MTSPRTRRLEGPYYIIMCLLRVRVCLPCRRLLDLLDQVSPAEPRAWRLGAMKLLHLVACRCAVRGMGANHKQDHIIRSPAHPPHGLQSQKKTLKPGFRAFKSGTRRRAPGITMARGTRRRMTRHNLCVLSGGVGCAEIQRTVSNIMEQSEHCSKWSCCSTFVSRMLHCVDV